MPGSHWEAGIELGPFVAKSPDGRLAGVTVRLPQLVQQRLPPFDECPDGVDLLRRGQGRQARPIVELRASSQQAFPVGQQPIQLLSQLQQERRIGSEVDAAEALPA